jgi:aminoglycoside phosphotransferase (APT) family kinase protein
LSTNLGIRTLDTGGFRAADPALDLVSAWHLLDATQSNVVRARLNPDEVQWRRGMASAFEQAMVLVWYYEVSNSLVGLWGAARTLDRLLHEGGEV